MTRMEAGSLLALLLATPMEPVAERPSVTYIGPVTYECMQAAASTD